jgi:hypothetical protein
MEADEAQEHIFTHNCLYEGEIVNYVDNLLDK